MISGPRPPYHPGDTVFESTGVGLVEVSDADGTLTLISPGPVSADELLRLMRERIKYLGSPLPEGFVPPPGIDIEELLKQLLPSPPTT
jgi:hypothetical protein